MAADRSYDGDLVRWAEDQARPLRNAARRGSIFIRQAGFWTVAIGPSNQDLYYLLQWESLDQRAQKFPAFQADPEWQEKRAATEADGPIVASISNDRIFGGEVGRRRHAPR